jgi:hypothetical protein
MEEFSHGKLSDCVETGEGASNQVQGSSKFDAPVLISVLDTEITNHRTAPIAQEQRPDWKETGRANDSLSQLLPGSGRQRSGLMFIEQLAYPTVTDSSSTAISWRA